jgi:Microcystin-dependent protein
MDEFITGQVVLFPFDFVPEGFMLCDGRSLNVDSYRALYSLINNRFGGDMQNFNIPNLKGKEPVPNMSYYICIEGVYPPRG